MSIEIGAVLNAQEITKESITILKKEGFKTVNIFFWESLDGIDLSNLAKIMDESQMNVSCLSIFGNPLREDLKGNDIRIAWKTLIENASLFSNPYISGFAGRKVGSSVSDSLLSWERFFSQILDDCYKKNVKGILFENCRMGDTWKTGKWNIAINPDAWKIMFDRLDDEKIGLQWEPCHQIGAFADPLNQLKIWIPKIKHIHGKDGTINYDVLKEKGIYGKDKFFSHTLPGMGDTSWKNIFEILHANNYNGSIDLEFQGESFIDNLEEAKKSLAYLIEAQHISLLL